MPTRMSCSRSLKTFSHLQTFKPSSSWQTPCSISKASQLPDAWKPSLTIHHSSFQHCLNLQDPPMHRPTSLKLLFPSLQAPLCPIHGILKPLGPDWQLPSPSSVLEVSTRQGSEGGRGSKGGQACPPSDKVRSEWGEAEDGRRNESRYHSAPFTYDNTGTLKGG